MKVIYIYLISMVMVASIFMVQATGAPVGSLSAPLSWEKGIFSGRSENGLILMTEFDFQQTDFIEFQDRYLWTNPGQPDVDPVHRMHRRSSLLELAYYGIKIGYSFEDRYIGTQNFNLHIENRIYPYLLVGSAISKVEFNFFNSTVIPDYDKKFTFNSNTNVFWGLGVTGLMHEQTVGRHGNVKVGYDVKFRYVTIEDDQIADSGLYYESTLNELQLALLASYENTKKGFFSPYAGVKVTYMAGKETFKDFNAHQDYSEDIHYSDDIHHSKNIGLVLGTSLKFSETVSFGIETRLGQEQGYGFHSIFKY